MCAPESTRLRQRLQAGGDVDPVAQQVSALGHHVVLVQADAHLQPVAFAHPLLHCDGAAQHLHGTREFGQQPVAGGLEQPASELRH